LWFGAVAVNILIYINSVLYASSSLKQNNKFSTTLQKKSSNRTLSSFDQMAASTLCTTLLSTDPNLSQLVGLIANANKVVLSFFFDLIL